MGEDAPSVHTPRLRGKLRPRGGLGEKEEGGRKRAGSLGRVGPAPVNNSVNDFFSPSLSSGQSPRAAANQQPPLGTYPAASGARAPGPARSQGAGARSPGGGRSAQSSLSFPPTPSLALPKTPGGPLPRRPDLGEVLGSAGWKQPAPLLCAEPGPRPCLCSHGHCCFHLLPPPTPCGPALGAGNRGMSQAPCPGPRYLPLPLQLGSGPREVGLGQKSSRGALGGPRRHPISSP